MTANTSLLALEARRRPKSVGGGSRRLFHPESVRAVQADGAEEDDPTSTISEQAGCLLHNLPAGFCGAGFQPADGAFRVGTSSEGVD